VFLALLVLTGVGIVYTRYKAHREYKERMEALKRATPQRVTQSCRTVEEVMVGTILMMGNGEPFKASKSSGDVDDGPY
jgi:hypothetical protein